MPHRLKVTRDPDAMVPHESGAVTSVGVFDGVHLGHQSILRTNIERAEELGAEPTVVTFAHHPKAVILGRAPRTLTTIEHRLALFARAGIRHVCVLTFDETLRDTSADEFTEKFLERGLNTRAFVLGFDSKFGSGRAGGPESLRQRGHGVEIAPKVLVGQRAVSSTAIREAIELGDLQSGAEMLGRPVTIYGEVVHGEALGRRLGLSNRESRSLRRTAAAQRRVCVPCAHRACACGVWRARPARAHRQLLTPRATSVAAPRWARPDAETLVEVHMLDFEGDLYGRRIELEFVERVRAEKKFSSLDELQEAIAADVAKVRKALARP